MSFAERGAALKAIADAIQGEREALLELAIANGGNTRSDAKFDVDGAIATLLAYADISNSLGQAKFLVDGEGIQLGRSARFHGQHVLVPRRGVAVHINAFNFPAWGFAEKAAVALLAGMPVLSKPATSSAMVAHRIMELVVEKKLLPEGALSFLVGGAGDLVSQLGAQDVLAFTGSGETGAKLRSARERHRAVRPGQRRSRQPERRGPWPGRRAAQRHVRAVPQGRGARHDAESRTEVHRDPPGSRTTRVVSSVSEDLAELLGTIRVGDPSSRTRAWDRSRAARSSPTCAKACSAWAADMPSAASRPLGPKGFFISPVLIEEPSEAVHEREVFGPVASLVCATRKSG